MSVVTSPSHYERAFENWLIDNRIRYVAVDQRKRAVFARSKIKSFDFLLYPSGPGTDVIIAEVKGRKFKGTSLAKLSGLENWVTMDDVRGLIRWEQVFGPGSAGAFVFAYRIEKIDVEFDGLEIYDFAQTQYAFFCIRLDYYRSFMTVRSPKWQTVTLPAAKFRAHAVPLDAVLL